MRPRLHKFVRTAFLIIGLFSALPCARAGTHVVQFFDATGEPLKSMPVEITNKQDYRNPTSSTGTLSPAGEIFLQITPSRQIPIMEYSLSITDPALRQQYVIDQIYPSQHEPNLTTVTVPFLNDWRTSHPRMQVFNGTMRPDDGSAVSAVEYSLQAIQGFREPVQQAVGYQPMVTGPDGRFRLAFRATGRVTGYGVSVTDRSQSDGKGAEKAFSVVNLSTRAPADILWRHTIPELRVGLVKSIGEPVIPGSPDSQSSPFNIPGVTQSGDFQMKETGTTRGAYLKLQVTKNGPDKELVAKGVPVPAVYTVKAKGRVFQNQRIKPGDTHTTFTELTSPFRVSGRIVDTGGNPVPNAIVLMQGHGDAIQNVFEVVRDHDRMEELYESTGADFESIEAYMAITNADGYYEILGDTMAVNALLAVSAEGYGSLNSRPFWNSRELPEWNNLLSDDIITTTIELRRSAIVKAQMVAEDGRKIFVSDGRMLRPPGGPSDPVYISAPGVITDSSSTSSSVIGYGGWMSMAVMAGDSALFTVPAGIPFKLQWHAKHGTGFSIPIEEPLQPGESRDLGRIQWKPQTTSTLSL